MIVVVIIGVLAGLAVPNYFRAVEQGRANEARTNLNIIHMGEKILRLNTAQFWGPGATTIAAANAALSVDMSARYYDTINITRNAGVDYQATLTRNGVEGGASSKWFRYNYTNGNANPVLTEGGNY